MNGINLNRGMVGCAQPRLIMRYTTWVALALIGMAVLLMAAMTWEARAADEAPPASSTLTWSQLKPSLDTYVGAVPYVWGAKDYNAWDCSGFVGRMLVDHYGLPIPGGSWDYCGTYQIAELLKDSFVTRGDSLEQFERDCASHTIRPGDIVMFGVEDRDAVHVGIVGEQASVYHAWTEEKGTVHTSMREIWGVPVGHDKTFTYYRIFRGVSDDKRAVRLQKRSALPSITLNNPNYSLAGAVYAIYDAKGNEVERLTCDAEGNTQISNELTPGSYSYQEISAPTGYLLDTQRHSFELNVHDADDAGVVTIQTAPEYPQTVQDIVVQKVDQESGKPSGQAGGTLNGAVFSVAYYPLDAQHITSIDDLEGRTPLKTWTITTDESGKAALGGWTSDEGTEMTGLPLGLAVIQEVQAPQGYLLNSQKQLVPLTLESKGSGGVQPLETTVKQQVKRGDLRLVKHASSNDGTTTPLAHVPFRITSQTTKETHVMYTNEHGVLSTHSNHRLHTAHTNEDTPEAGVWFGEGVTDDNKGALPYDTYIVEELPCPENKNLILAAPLSVAIAEDAVEVDLGTVINEEQPYTLISKTDITGAQELPGAQLQIFDSDKNLVESWISGNQPHKVHLKPGTYRLHEERAPAGYVVAADITFEVAEGMNVTPVTMVDEAIEIEIVKVDAATHRPLAGAHFELMDSQGLVIDTWISTQEAHRLHALPEGLYTLHETEAPAGYIPMEDLRIEVKHVSDVQRFEAINRPVDPSVPYTSDPRWPAIILAALGALLSAAGLAWRRILYAH